MRAVPYGARAVPYGTRAVPHGARAVPHGTRAAPYGTRAVPYGTRAVPYGMRAVPYGMRAVPHGTRAAPHGTRAVPYCVPHRRLHGRPHRVERRRRRCPFYWLSGDGRVLRIAQGATEGTAPATISTTGSRFAGFPPPSLIAVVVIGPKGATKTVTVTVTDSDGQSTSATTALLLAKEP
jgi:hypothetical protein